MKTKCVAIIVSLSPGIQPVLERAISLLNSVKQDAFIFEGGGSLELPQSPTVDTPRLWSELGAVLVEERKRRRCERLIAVLDDPIEHNWFSHTAYGKNTAWITTHDWEFYSDLPVVSFMAYDIVLNLVLMQLVPKPEDEAWLMGEVIHAQETRECISDLCAYKPDISRKIRSGKICPDCSRIIEARLGKEARAAIAMLLQAISRTAHPSKPAPSIRDFPILAHMRDATDGFLLKEQSRVTKAEFEMRKMEAEQRVLERRLEEINQQRKENNDQIEKSKTRLAHLNEASRMGHCAESGAADEDTVHSERQSLAEEVERRYPFPIAYCFRAMRAELNPTDRWNALFELYGLIVRYTVFALLSDHRHQLATCPEDLRLLIQKLKFGYAGDWGKACLALLKHGRQSAGQRFLRAFLESWTTEQLSQFQEASRSLVQARNSMAHGFTGDRQACQELFQRHQPLVKRMLKCIQPLSEYVLFRPIQIVENLDGQCVYFSKIMAGSDPQFIPKQMVSSAAPETACQLLSPDGNTLTMHPWLHLNRCDSCLRDMVFVYDAIHMREGRETALLREYPSNHEQLHPALVSQVKKLLLT